MFWLVWQQAGLKPHKRKENTMAAYSIMFRLCENIVGKNDKIIQRYECNLPHGSFVQECFCNAFNDKSEFDIEAFAKEELGDWIGSVKAIPWINEFFEDVTFIAIQVIPAKGHNLTYGRKAAFYRFANGQMTDGFGEGFSQQILTAPDGTRLFVN